jgi:hypothetical protein
MLHKQLFPCGVVPSFEKDRSIVHICKGFNRSSTRFISNLSQTSLSDLVETTGDKNSPCEELSKTDKKRGRMVKYRSESTHVPRNFIKMEQIVTHH